MKNPAFRGRGSRNTNNQYRRDGRDCLKKGEGEGGGGSDNLQMLEGGGATPMYTM